MTYTVSAAPPDEANPVVFSPSTGHMMTFRNGTWYKIIDSTSNEVELMIQWVRNKKEEEARLAALCEKHPGLRDAKTAFEVMLRLAETG